jgi:hypothetical protein
MKVKIIKSMSESMWYSKRIGQVYEVVGYSDKRKKCYKVIEDSQYGLMLLYVDDCEIIDSSPYKINWIYEIKAILQNRYIMNYVWIGIAISFGVLLGFWK